MIAALILFTSNYDQSIAWAERQVFRVPFSISQWDEEPQAGWQIAHDSLEDILAKYGPKLRTFRALAQCELRMGAYVKALKNSHLAGSSDLVAKANERLRIVKSVPNGISATPLPNGGWVVVSAITKSYQEWPNSYSRIRITFVNSGRQTTLSPFSDDWEANENTALLRDMDGDHKPELLIWSAFYGVSISPRSMSVYQLGLRPKFMGHASSSEGFWLKDINQDGKTELLCRYAYGTNYDALSHAEQPRWRDIYAIHNVEYENDNQSFPKQFREIGQDQARAVKLLKGQPDPEIRLHQARLSIILGHLKQARKQLKVAETDAHRWLRLRYEMSKDQNYREGYRNNFRDQIEMIRDESRSLENRKRHG